MQARRAAATNRHSSALLFVPTSSQLHYFCDLAQSAIIGPNAPVFLETARVHGHVYGTSLGAVRDVQASGRICILDIDVQGYRQLQRICHGQGEEASQDSTPQPTTSTVRDQIDSDLFPSGLASVAVVPPSLHELELRLRGRGTETEEAVAGRLRAARAEIEFCQSPEAGFETVIVNHDSYTVSVPATPDCVVVKVRLLSRHASN
jgi:guanylate kinase